MEKIIKPYAFIDKKGNKITKENHMAKMARRAGVAYAFFNCKASKEEIEAELPTIRECAQTPSALEISLKDIVEGIKGNAELMSITSQAKEEGLNYIIEATCPKITNKKTADELADILNQAYQSPIYKPEQKEPFRCAIFYEEKDRYISID